MDLPANKPENTNDPQQPNPLSERDRMFLVHLRELDEELGIAKRPSAPRASEVESFELTPLQMQQLLDLGFFTLADFGFTESEIARYNTESHSDKVGTLDQPIAVEDKSLGVTLAQQSAPMVASRVENRGVARSTLANAVNNDSEWTLASMLSRWNLFDTISWPASAAAGTTIVTYNILQDLLKNAISNAPFERFDLFRCKSIEISFECVGYRFSQGRLLASMRYTGMNSANLSFSNVDLRTAVTLPHVSLDPTKATVAHLSLPFTFQREYLDLVAGDSLGQLNLTVQNPFVPGTTGPSAATIQMYVSIIDPVFKIPTPGAGKFTDITRRHPRRPDDEQGEVVSVPRKLQPGVFLTESHSLIDGLIDEGANGLKKIAQEIIPDNVVGTILGSLDRVQLGENPSPLVHKDQQYLSNTKTIDFIDVLTADPSAQQLSTADTFAAPVNEMMVDEIIKKKAKFVTSVTWSTSNATGDTLWSSRVGPRSEFPISFSPVTPTRIGPIDAVSKYFSFWHGSISYIFEFVSTQFHEGKVAITYSPRLDTTTANALDINSVMSQYVKSFFLRNGANITKVTCPFIGDTSWRMCYNGEPISDVTSATSLRLVDFFSGAVSLRVLGPLNAPETVANSIEINIYEIAGDDFQFAMNTAAGSSIQFFTPRGFTTESHSLSEKSVKTEDQPDRNTPFHTMPSTMLCAENGEFNTQTDQQFGEAFVSLKDLCKRYQSSFSASLTIDPTTIDPLIISGDLPLVIPISTYETVYADSPTPRSMANMFSDMAQMFRGVRGGMCRKLKVSAYGDPQSPGQPRYDLRIRAFASPQTSNQVAIDNWNLGAGNNFPHNSDSTETIVPNPLPLGYATQTQIAEYKMPFLINRNYALLNNSFDKNPPQLTNSGDYQNQYEVVAIQFENFPQAPSYSSLFKWIVRIDMLSAFADETSMGVWIGPPEAYLARLGPTGPVIGPDNWTSASMKPVSKIASTPEQKARARK